MQSNKCPGNKEGHVYSTNGNTMKCQNCPKIQRYDPVSRTWKTV